LSTSKPVQKQLLPFQQESVATNQQSVPLPYLAGTRLISIRWISPALNEIVVQVAGNGKKG
jgi:hypothetical protein